MHYYFVLAIIMALPSFLLADANCASSADFYVAITGLDSNPGTSDKPFRTFEKARNAVRTMIRSGQKKDIVVLIHGGTYRINQTIKLDERDSGKNGFKITYKNFPGEWPVFSGGQQITNWQSVANSKVYCARLSTDVCFRELYVNGKLANLAAGRKIKTTGWDTADDPEMQKYNKLETVKTYQGNLDVYQGYKTTSAYRYILNWKNTNNIECVYEQGWTCVICPVDQIKPADDGGVLILMRNPCFRDAQIKAGLHVGDPSYFQNALELLDEPGEWYYDQTAKELYYFSLPHQDMNRAEVVMPVVEKLLDLKGMLDNPIHNLVFEGLSFEYCTFNEPSRMGFAEVQAAFVKDPKVDDNGHSHYIKPQSGIVLDSAKDIMFHRCIFSKFGGAGINIQNGASGNIIRGCKIIHMGASGIQVGGFNMNDAHPADSRKMVKGNIINNCYFKDIGEIYKGAVGIAAGYTIGTEITHNDISEVAYSGINLGWGWGYWDKGGRKDAPANYKVFNERAASYANRVEYNHIYHVMRKLHDGAGIYTLSMMEDTVIRCNVIHDNEGQPGGIYLDEGSGGMEIAENILYNVSLAFNYNDIGIAGRRQTNVYRNNYTDIKPNQAGFPKDIAQCAGLTREYCDLKTGDYK